MDELILKGKELEEYNEMIKARESSKEKTDMEAIVKKQFEEMQRGIKTDFENERKALFQEVAEKVKEVPYQRKASSFQKYMRGMIEKNRQQYIDGFCELGGTEDLIRSGESQNEGTGSQGLYSVAPVFDTDVMFKVMNESVLFQKANVIPMNTLTAYFTPMTSGVSVADSSELGTPTHTRVALDQQTVTVKDTRASTVFSNNLLADAPQLYNKVLQSYTEAWKTKYNQILFTDAVSDSKNFNGVLKETVTGSGQGLTGTTTGGAKVYFLSGDYDTVTNDDLDAVVMNPSSMSPEDWANAEWYFNHGWSQNLAAIKNLQGTPLLYDPQGGVPKILKTFPINYVRQMPLTALTSGQPFAAFGNLKTTCHFWNRQDATFNVVREGTVNGINCGEQNATGLVMFRRYAFKVYVEYFNDETRTGLTLIARS